MRCGMATRRVRGAQRLALCNPSGVVNGWHVEARIVPGGASVRASRRPLWRELDATRNSIQMAAQALYSHKQLHQKNTSEMQEMLLITFEIEGDGIEDEDVTFRISIKNLKTGQLRRSQCAITPHCEDTEDSDD